jgi:hypothetical protein
MPVLSLSPTLPLPATTGPAAEHTEDEVVPPPVPPAGALAALAPGDLSALEHGMQRFLGQLEKMGQRLVGDTPGSGATLWLVAGATAVAACELARRQLRRDPRVPGLRPLGGVADPFAG